MAPSRRFPLAAAVLLLTVARGAPLWAQPRVVVGQIINLTGSVEVQRGKSAALKGTLLFPLEEGDMLRVRPGGTAEVVLFQKGARFRLAATGTARVAPGALTAVSGAKPQPLTNLSPTFARRLRAPAQPAGTPIMGVVVRGANDAGMGPTRPSPNGAVRAAPVTLRWGGLIDAEQLHLQISLGEEDIHHTDLPAAAREYQVPNGILKPGKAYDWSVTALRGAAIGSWTRATVRVLPTAEVAEVAAIEKEGTAALAAAPDDPAPLLLLAQAYERFGLKEDALAHYQAVLKLRPGDAGVQAAVKRVSPGGS